MYIKSFFFFFFFFFFFLPSSYASHFVFTDGECINFESIDAKFKGGNLNVFDYDSLGNVSKKPIYIIKDSNDCVNNLPVGYYKVNSSEIRADSYFSIVNRNIPINKNLGVITHFGNLLKKQYDYKKLLPLIRLIGIGNIRDELYWHNIEKQPGGFVFPSEYEQYIRASVSYGIKPLIVLGYGNGIYKNDEEQIANFSLYSGAVVKHYAKYTDLWEIWNEPKSTIFNYSNWDGYNKIYSSAYNEIKKMQPNATVIACGGGGKMGNSDGECITNLVARNKDNIDAFSVHMYFRNSPETGLHTFLRPFANISSTVNFLTIPIVLEKNVIGIKKDGYKPFLTEFGWASTNKDGTDNSMLQAAYLIRGIANNFLGAFFQKIYFYDFVDDGVDKTNKEHNYGVLYFNQQPKPSFSAISFFNYITANRLFTKSIMISDSVMGIHIDKDNESILMVFSLDGRNHEISPPNAKKVYDWQGKVVISHNGSFTVNSMPLYLTSTY
ncbi:Beta-xylosidase [Raoultella planticola]|uniref:Glycoside hydrolase family 5 domain-containing protein n=1 Tax=Klebsiella sp. 2212/52 TaxID=1497829 RepID=A0A0P0YSS1_9ENTR|nr:cellulase family glycosylhydrolase [Raoultella planticola]BAT24114.1 hypothetical protein [Klebsiella sp. 2212/52]VTM98072.1 Beta-xylosidase [Raoultella planticola]